jgi:hypothetical protein
MLSVAMANNVLAKVFSNTAFSFHPWLSLNTGDPGQTGANELAGLTRVDLGSSFANASVSGQLSISSSITFPAPPAGVVTYFSIWDAATGGNFIHGGSITSAVTLDPAHAFIVVSGLLILQLSDTPQLSAFVSYLRNKILDYMYRKVDFLSSPVYSSLHTANPGQGGSFEVTGGSYQRAVVTPTAIAAGSTNNQIDLVFLGMPSCNLAYAGGYDQASGGNFLMGAQMTVDGVPGIATINAGDAVVFQAGNYITTAQ